MDDEGRLQGGWMRGAHRVADDVHRPRHPNSFFVKDLLSWLERENFEGSPRHIGFEDGDEVLGYVEGFVPIESNPEDIPSWVWGGDALRSAFHLLRRYHDLTAFCPLRMGSEVVCHNDISPWNTVFRDGRAFAFIDWDSAAPGCRLDDLGYALWRYVRLGFPDGPQPEDALKRVCIACDAYRLEDRRPLVTAIADSQEHHYRWFRERQVAGDTAVSRLIELGALTYIEESRQWLDRHRHFLTVGLTGS